MTKNEDDYWLRITNELKMELAIEKENSRAYRIAIVNLEARIAQLEEQCRKLKEKS